MDVNHFGKKGICYGALKSRKQFPKTAMMELNLNPINNFYFTLYLTVQMDISLYFLLSIQMSLLDRFSSPISSQAAPLVVS